MKAVKVSVISGLVLGLIFLLACAVFHSQEINHLFLATAVGTFVGFVGAPEISPESFSNPKAFQTISGMCVGLLVAFFYSWGIPELMGSVLVFGVLGYTINYWGNHVPIP